MVVDLRGRRPAIQPGKGPARIPWTLSAPAARPPCCSSGLFSARSGLPQDSTKPAASAAVWAVSSSRSRRYRASPAFDFSTSVPEQPRPVPPQVPDQDGPSSGTRTRRLVPCPGRDSSSVCLERTARVRECSAALILMRVTLARYESDTIVHDLHLDAPRSQS